MNTGTILAAHLAPAVAVVVAAFAWLRIEEPHTTAAVLIVVATAALVSTARWRHPTRPGAGR